MLSGARTLASMELIAAVRFDIWFVSRLVLDAMLFA